MEVPVQASRRSVQANPDAHTPRREYEARKGHKAVDSTLPGKAS